MFRVLDGVLIKWAAMCRITQSCFRVVGTAFVQTNKEYSIILLIYV